MKPVAIFAVATGSICIMIAVYLPPLPQENWGGMFSPWEADDTSLNKIYAVQSDPVAAVEPRYEVGFEPEEVPQAGVAPWNAIQA